MQTDDGTSDLSWDNVPYIFFDKKIRFEYNMAKLLVLGTSVAKLKSIHNCSKLAKEYSNDAMGLRSVLYLGEGTEVMLTSNLWAEAGLKNDAKGKVIDVVYQYDNGPINGDFPESVVVQFCE